MPLPPKVQVLTKVQFLTVMGCEKTIMPIRLGSETRQGEKMDWKPKGSNRPTDHDLEVAIFEAP
jgi:hypothetical protein